MGEGLTRRELLALAAQAAAAFALAGCGRGALKADGGRPVRKPRPGKLAVASKSDPASAARAAVAAIGGMSAFVRKGDFVVIKPNAAWARPPEAAATTNPDVLAGLVAMCKEAGAGEILVIDHAIDQPAEMVFTLTGIKAAAEKAGARVRAAQNESMYRRIEMPAGSVLASDQVIKDVLRADVFINVPIAKTHGETTLTLGMKNLMGVIWNRQAWHSSDLHRCIAEFAGVVKPDLVVLDATRLLLTNGPKGPGNTKHVGQVVAGTDQVAVDAYGASLFGIKASEIEHIALAHQRGLGEIDYRKVKVG